MKIDKEKLEDYAKKRGIKFIVLFGSQAKGISQEGSDFDIAVLRMNKKNSDLNVYNEILFGLCEILNIPDYKIDLTDLNYADPFLKYEITANGKLLYGNDKEYAIYKVFAARDYIETEDLRKLTEKLVFKKQKLLAEKIYAQ